MKKQLAFTAICLFNIHSISAKFVNKNEAGYLGASFGSAIGAVISATAISFDSNGPIKSDEFKTWLGGSAVVGAICGCIMKYIADRYRPESLYKWALAIKNEVEVDSLFVCRNGNDVKCIKKFMHKHGYPFLCVVHSLFNNVKKLEYAHEYIEYVLAECSNIDEKLEQDCEKLLSDSEKLLFELKTFAKRFIYTKQWLHELGFEEDSFKDRMGTISYVDAPYYLFDSIKWSNELIGGRENIFLLDFDLFVGDWDY